MFNEIAHMSLKLQVGMFKSEQLQYVHTCSLMLHYSSGWGNQSCDAKLSSLIAMCAHVQS